VAFDIQLDSDGAAGRYDLMAGVGRRF